MKTEDRYYNDQKRSEVMETARRLRRKYLRYQQAEIVYSLSHKKLMELASDAEAIYVLFSLHRNTSKSPLVSTGCSCGSSRKALILAVR